MVSLYRCFDVNKNLLYVGISRRALARISNHCYHHFWTSAIRTVTIEHLPSRPAALRAERNAILKERPMFNLPIGRHLWRLRAGKARRIKRTKRNGS